MKKKKNIKKAQAGANVDSLGRNTTYKWTPNPDVELDYYDPKSIAFEEKAPIKRHVISKSDIDAFNESSLSNDHILMNMLSGERKKILEAFKDPNVQQLEAAYTDLRKIPRFKQGEFSQPTGDREVFDIISLGYKPYKEDPIEPINIDLPDSIPTDQKKVLKGSGLFKTEYYKDGTHKQVPINDPRLTNSGFIPSQKNGGIIEDNRGQYAHPGKVTKIKSNKITMKGLKDPLLGISNTGDVKMMYPDQDYAFDGSTVTEIPLKQQGGNLYNKLGGNQAFMQGAGAFMGGMQEGNENGPSAAQRGIGQFGPWGSAISQVSQMGTNYTDNSGNLGVYTAGKVIFDPASAWSNKDLSTKDRIIGGLNPIYGAKKAFEAKQKKEYQSKELARLADEAGSFMEPMNRQYIRPEDNILDPNSVGSTYGTGSSFLKQGGDVPKMQQAGELQTLWGGQPEVVSQNPYLPGEGESIKFKGDSHKEGGIGVSFGGNKVEVEGGEPAVKLNQRDLTIFGNMKIPSYGVTELDDIKAKGKKFKTYIDDLNKIEKKQNKVREEGLELVDDSDSSDPFEKLSFNSGKAMMLGSNMKLQSIAKKKQIAADVQNAILDTAEELNLDSEELSKGNIKKMKKSKKTAQAGGNVNYDDYHTADARGIYSQTGLRPIDTSMLTDVPLTSQNPFTANYRQGMSPNLGRPTTPIVPIQNYGDRIQQVPLSQQSMSGDFTHLSDTSRSLENPSREDGFAGINSPEQGNGNFNAMQAINTILPYFRPSNQRGLDPNQLTGERYAIASNQLEPVQAQKYTPLLEQSTNVSFQDQLNANQADFNSLARLSRNNPSAQATLAAQKYRANSGVLADEFRVNQTNQLETLNRNRQVLNDATIKNLQILDQQYIRQEGAKARTKATHQAALSSISDKIAKNKLENRTLGMYENLYNYRFGNNGYAWNMNGLAQSNTDSGYISDVDETGNVTNVDSNSVRLDKNGMPVGSTRKNTKITKQKSNANGGIVKSLKNY